MKIINIERKKKDYDFIVVGAGNGGLSAAAYLVKNNKKVLVLEKHNLPGGCATSFVRGRFEFEATLHELCSVGEEKEIGIVRKMLDNYDFDIDWVPVNESFCSISKEKNDKGFYVSMPVGIENFINKMEEIVPGCYESVKTYFEFCRMFSDGVEWLGKYNNEPNMIAKIKMLFKWYDFMRLVPVSTDELLRRIGVPDKAREIIESYWDYIGTPSRLMSCVVYGYMIYSYLLMKPYIVKNRSHELSLAFDNYIRKMGGDIWYCATVKKIDVKNNVAYGVELDDGTYINARYIIVNVHPNTVFLNNMIPVNEIPIRDRKMLNARTLGQCCFTVYLALNKSIKELGFKGYDTFFRTTGDNSIQYENMHSINGKENCFTILNEVIPDCSPSGTCFIQFSKFFPSDINIMKEVNIENYFKFKDSYTFEMINDFEKYTNIKISDCIEEIVISTPATWARYINSPNGSVYGYMPQTWDGMFPRVQSGHKIDHTIKRLRFVGAAGTQMDGYSQAYLSGVEQARYAILDIKKGE